MRLIQFLRTDGQRALGCAEDANTVHVLSGCEGTYALAKRALTERAPLARLARELVSTERVDYDELIERGAILPPLDHPDPAHMLISSSGLTHLGNESTRESLRRALQLGDATLTDSLRLFKQGLEEGRPADDGPPGVAPEWHFKGTGHSVIAPHQDFPVPSFARDASEEPELAGLYLIDSNAKPRRLGFALANELSDHITERSNSGLVSQAKLGVSSFGPEILLDPLPRHILGLSRITRKGRKRWERPFLTGEDNMSHSIGNIEFHHFKHDPFLVPGDVHVHYFGTATLSFAEGIKVDGACRFEISAPLFGRPLINGIRRVQNSFRFGEMLPV